MTVPDFVNKTDTVYADGPSGVNKVADDVKSVQQATQKATLAHVGAHPTYGRCRLLMESHRYEFNDVDGSASLTIAAHDEHGNRLLGAFTDSSNAVVLKSVNTTDFVSPPSNPSGYPTNIWQQPRSYDVVRYSADGSEATLRIYANPGRFEAPPIYLDVVGDNLYVLCADRTKVLLYSFSSNSTSFSKIRISLPTAMSEKLNAGISPHKFIRDMSVNPVSNEMVLAYFDLGTGDGGDLYRINTVTGEPVTTTPLVSSVPNLLGCKYSADGASLYVARENYLWKISSLTGAELGFIGAPYDGDRRDNQHVLGVHVDHSNNEVYATFAVQHTSYDEGDHREVRFLIVADANLNTTLRSYKLHQVLWGYDTDYNQSFYNIERLCNGSYNNLEYTYLVNNVHRPDMTESRTTYSLDTFEYMSAKAPSSSSGCWVEARYSDTLSDVPELPRYEADSFLGGADTDPFLITDVVFWNNHVVFASREKPESLILRNVLLTEPFPGSSELRPSETSMQGAIMSTIFTRAVAH